MKIDSPGDDHARAAATDGTGGVFVAGMTGGDLGSPFAGGPFDAWVGRISGSGNTQWIVQHGTSEWDIATAASSDGVGGVFVCGGTMGQLGSPPFGLHDAWVARLDALGGIEWTRQLGTPIVDIAYAAMSDGAGGCFVAGSTSGNLAGLNPALGSEDAWLARYDGAGLPLWTIQFGSVPLDRINAMTTDGVGGVVVTGHTYGALGAPLAGIADPWLARFDASCGPKQVYCVASATSIPGCKASIGSTGSPSVSQPNAFLLTSGSVPGGNLGICFFNSTGTASTPFGTLGGKICMQGPIYRTAPKPSGGSSGSCNGSYTFRLTDLIAASLIVTSGATIHAQVWARDPANVDGFLLSDGLEVVVCP